jgi:hypothetical protein
VHVALITGTTREGRDLLWWMRALTPARAGDSEHH